MLESAHVGDGIGYILSSNRTSMRGLSPPFNQHGRCGLGRQPLLRFAVKLQV